MAEIVSLISTIRSPEVGRAKLDFSIHIYGRNVHEGTRLTVIEVIDHEGHVP